MPQQINFTDIQGGKVDVIQNGQYFSVNIQHITDVEIHNDISKSKLNLTFPLMVYLMLKQYILHTCQKWTSWSRAMGGSTIEENLLLACSECNQGKHDYIDASDFHYEEICLVNWDETSDEFINELKREYKLALWSKSSFVCEYCGSKAQDMGRLEFIKKNPNDSWHFLNISVVCPSCAHKLSRFVP